MSPIDVLQGSVLGPFLFSLFTTPVGQLMDGFGVSYHQYANDTQLHMVINTGSVDKLSTSAYAVTRWHLENGLLLNPNKTEAIVTGTWQQLAKFDKTGGINSHSNFEL